MFVFFSIMSAVVIGTFMRTISSVIIASAPGLPLVSISRRSLGLPATTFRRFLSSFKGSSLYEMTAMQKYSALHNALCSFYNSVLVSILPDNVTFSCTLSGMLVHHSSNTNRFIQRHILVVLWWLAALPTL